MKLPHFASEEWLDVYETQATLDLAQSSIASFTLNEILKIDGHTDPAEFFAGLSDRTLSYGDIEGSEAFKEEVAKLYSTVAPENVLQSNGGTGANLLSILAFVEPGDHIIGFVPGYQQLYDIPRSLGAKVTLITLREENNWMPDLDEVAAAIRPNTRFIALANANNPTGALLQRPELEALVEIARKADAYLHVDEVFESFSDTVDVPRVADLYEKGISTGSLSKGYSMPGIRVGWTATSKELADHLRHYRDYVFICAGGIDDALAVHTLRNREAIFARNRSLLHTNLQILSDWVAGQERVSLVVPPGVSVAFPHIEVPLPLEDFCVGLLRDTGVLLIPGSRFGIEGYARLGYCCHTDVLEQGLATLGDYLRKFD